MIWQTCKKLWTLHFIQWLHTECLKSNNLQSNFTQTTHCEWLNTVIIKPLSRVNKPLVVMELEGWNLARLMVHRMMNTLPLPWWKYLRYFWRGSDFYIVAPPFSRLHQIPAVCHVYTWFDRVTYRVESGMNVRKSSICTYILEVLVRQVNIRWGWSEQILIKKSCWNLSLNSSTEFEFWVQRSFKIWNDIPCSLHSSRCPTKCHVKCEINSKSLSTCMPRANLRWLS